MSKKKRNKKVVTSNNSALFPTPLKDKTAQELAAEVLTTPKRIEDSFTLGTALGIAFYAHARQVRHTPIVTSSGEIRHKSTEYIYHPLRNTVRLMRWGVTDIDVLVGSVLHDTVEDAPRRIREWGVSTRDLSFITDEDDEDTHRRLALKRISNIFNNKVSHIVNEVTNPLSEGTKTKRERNEAYVKHVSVAVRDPQVFLVKFSDVCDNALSLHFTPPSQKRNYLAARYLPLAPILDTAFCGIRHILEEEKLVSQVGLRDIEKRLTGMEKYLTKINDAQN